MLDITIPTRFESILANRDLDPTPLIVPVDQDLRQLEMLRRAARTQNGGVLAFLVGLSGIGKTTAVYSAAACMPEVYNPVLPVPHDVPLRGVSEWLADKLPPPSARTHLVLFDGREVSDDTVGLRQLLASLNQLLRRRPDVVALWPTTDEDWLADLYRLASAIGGQELIPVPSVPVTGPAPQTWPDVLSRLLIQFDRTTDELALDATLLDSFAQEAHTVGGYLGKVSRAVAGRIDEVQLAKQLPDITFVITSVSEVVGEANRLRRAATYLLKAEELLSYSRRSNAAKWWQSRMTTPEYHLGYVIALFRARLATMTPSSVVYACAEFGDADLRSLPKSHGVGRSPANADRTFKNTDLYRHLSGRTTGELTSTTKGKTAESTLNAYAAIQAASAARHKAINQAICALAGRNVPDFAADLARFELDAGDQDLFTDVVVPFRGEEAYLEFHHVSEAHCRAATMSAYIMEKLQAYAIHYNIVPR